MALGVIVINSSGAPSGFTRLSISNSGSRSLDLILHAEYTNENESLPAALTVEKGSSDFITKNIIANDGITHSLVDDAALSLGNHQDDVQPPSSAGAESVWSTSLYDNVCKVSSEVLYADVLDCSNAGQDNISYMIYSSGMVKLDLDEFNILKSHGEMGAGHIDEDLIFLMRILVLGFVALPVLCSTLRKGYGVQVLYSSNLYKQALLRMSAVW